MALIKCSPGQQWPGFSFALHRHGAGLLFCPAAIQPHTSVYSAFCAVNAITIHAIKQHTELCRGFSCDCTRSTAHDTKPTQAAIIPPAPRWSVSQRRNTSSTYQIPAPRRTLYRSAQPPIIIRYIRVQEGYAPVMNPRQTVQQIAGRASPAGSRCFPRPAACNLAPVSSHGAPAGTLHPAGQSSSRGAAGGAEPLAATAASLFGLSPDS